MPAYPRLWRVFSGFFGMRLHMRVASARVGGTAGADRTGQSLYQRTYSAASLNSSSRASRSVICRASCR